MSKQIAFVGLGTMGLPMASNLAKSGYTVRGFDLGLAQLEAASEIGIQTVSSIAEACKGADILVTMLPKGEHVRSVILGAGGALEALPQGSIIVDCSTIDAATSRHVAHIAAAEDISVLDAPVSGGVGGATAGTLTFMVGGPEAVLANAQFVFDVMGSQTVHCGSAGSGQLAKACNNLVFGINLAAVSEAFVLGERSGLSPEKLFAVLSTSSGNSWALNNFCPRPGLAENAAANHDYKAKFAADLLAKDLGLAIAAADEVGSELQLGEITHDFVSELVETNPKLDCSAIIKVIEKAPAHLQ